MFLSVKEEAAGPRAAPGSPPLPPSVSATEKRGWRYRGVPLPPPALGGRAGRTPSSVRFPPGQRGIYRGWNRWLQPRAPGPARGLVLPGASGRRRPPRTGTPGPGALGGVPRGSLLPSPGRGRLARPGVAGPALSARRAAALRPEPPRSPSRIPDPRAAAGEAWSLSRSCGPTHGRRRDSRADALLGRGGGFGGDAGLSPAGGRGPRPAAACAVQVAPSGRAAEWVAAPPPQQGLRRGLLPGVQDEGGWGGKGRAVTAGAERRPAEAGPFPPAPVASTCSQARWWEPSPQGPAANPALPPRQTQNRASAARKPSCPQTSAGREAALRGATAGVCSRPGASLPASPEAAPE